MPSDAVAAVGPAHALVEAVPHAVMTSGHLSDGACSLSRRSRVRRKNSRRDEDDDSSSDIPSTSGDISSGQLFVKIPPPNARSDSSPKSLGTLESGAPPRPLRSPRRLQTAPALGDKSAEPYSPWIPRHRTRSIDRTATRPAIDDSRGRETHSENGQYSRAQRARGKSLPRYALRNNSLSDSSEQPSPLTPNAFNDILPIPVFAPNRRFRHQPRDSNFTHESTASSSVYPKSTSTEGSYPSPPSLPAQDTDDRFIMTVDPADNSHTNELLEMEADDVSYRLRLLMQNNYYLPPAHSKPFVDMFSPETPKKSPVKSSSPTFFDIFKVVKKKNPTIADQRASGATLAPMLRTTSDSSTLSGLLRPEQSGKSMQPPHVRTPRQETKGRVVVVRERMDDLVSVARQVEQEMKVREVERRRDDSESSHSERIRDNFVDPTDSVDLPPCPSNEFFGPQAALLHGMGIDSSVGAALLADQLPPSSPGIWSIETEDVAWRRAILHAAVGHSLNNSSVESPGHSGSDSSRFQTHSLSSPVDTSVSASLFAPTVTSHDARLPPLPSAISNDVGTSTSAEAPRVRKQPIIGQRILNRIMDEHEPSEDMGDSAESLRAEVSNASLDKEKTKGLTVAVEPVRASSPTVPTMPLHPPPRRVDSIPTFTTGLRSDSAPDKGKQADDSLLSTDATHQRVPEGTTLRLSDVYESHVGLSGAFGELARPVSQSAVKPGTEPEGSSRLPESLSVTSGSHYSDDGDDFSTFHTPREHTLASTFVGSRPSLGSLSVPRESCDSSVSSLTTSGFRDAYDQSTYADSLIHSSANTLGGNSRTSSRVSDNDDSRYVVSPPPRTSSALSRNVVHASLRSRRAEGSPSPFAIAREGRNSTNEQRGPEVSSGLNVPRLTVQGIYALDHQATSYPASPISFFDAVEMQSQQDQSEEESSDSGDGDGESDTVSSAGSNVRDDISINSSVGGRQSDSASMSPIHPRAGSIHSAGHATEQILSPLMQQRNASLPQLDAGPSQAKEQHAGLGHDAGDRWTAISNVQKLPTRSGFWPKKQTKGRGAVLSQPRMSESTADRMKHEAAKGAFAGSKRPHTADAGMTGGDTESLKEKVEQLNPSVRRLDGMLIEHMEREKEVLRRITTSVSKTVD